MKFNDCGIIVSCRNYGQNSLIIKIFTQENGICTAFVKNAKSKKSNAIYQVGNLVTFEYRSRIEDNLGQIFYCDLVKSYQMRLIFDQLKLSCSNTLFAMLDDLFLERESYSELFDEIKNFLEILLQDGHHFLIDYVKLELSLLRHLGYAIDLSCCAVTNEKSNLAYVSPKSGRAVTLEVGRPYANALLPLPDFLVSNDFDVTKAEESMLDGLNLTGYFLKKFGFNDSILDLKTLSSKKSQLYRHSFLEYIKKQKSVLTLQKN